MKVSAYHRREIRGGPKYHIADILPAASKGALLALVVDANKKGFSVKGTRTIVILVALSIVL